DRVLAPNEQIVHETGLHWIVFLTPLVCLAIAFFAAQSVNPNDAGAAGAVVLIFSGHGLFFLFKALIDWWTTEIAVTTHRVVYKRGLIARNTIEINFNRIEGLDF